MIVCSEEYNLGAPIKKKKKKKNKEQLFHNITLEAWRKILSVW